jgi:pyruvate/2-oxoacid:ferredoxin oxidoreductase beta subunit
MVSGIRKKIIKNVTFQGAAVVEKTLTCISEGDFPAVDK